MLIGPIRHYSPGPGQQIEPRLAHVTGISPLRGSLRAAPIKMAGQEYPADAVIAQQLAKAVSRQMDPLCTLFGRRLCGCPHRWSSRISWCRLPRFSTARQRTYSNHWIFGFQGTRRGHRKTPSLLIQIREGVYKKYFYFSSNFFSFPRICFSL